MLSVNKNYSLLNPSYLFPEMKRRVSEFSSKNLTSVIYNLGEGDTTQPLTSTVSKAMIRKIKNMSSGSDFMGYSDPLGQIKLRNTIVNYYKTFLKGSIQESEVFISDGAKADLFNIQTIFSTNIKIALQNPSYPVYIDSLVINGNAGTNNHLIYNNIIFLTGSPENNFIPNLPNKKIDLFYLCFPNNPTGAVATRKQLKKYIDYANENGSIIIFDSVYSWFIREAKYPKSIYEISGADKCAIEIQSFSKLAGFPSVRLGWTIVPHTLSNKVIRGGQLNALWKRRQQTGFNGASVIIQEGGIAALSSEGLKENNKNINYYMDNTDLIKKTCNKIGFKSYGGINAPYVWVETPKKIKSWDFFDLLLKKANTICTPGIGFGAAGEGFFRLSGFAQKEDTKKALDKITNVFS